MERLTERTGEGQAIPRMDLNNNGHQRFMERLAEYEDLEEQGKLLKLPCYTVWFICDKKTATVMPKSIEYLAVYEIDGIDKKGYYWSTRSKALAALKEL